MTSESQTGAQEPSKPSPIWWQSIVAIIPIAVALGYTVAYLYELGYCNAFGVPTEFISPDATHVLIAVGKVFLSAVALFWTIYVFITMTAKPKKSGPIRRRLVLLITIGIIYIAFAIDYPSARREWYFIIPIYFIFISMFFIAPAIAFRRTKGYRRRLIVQDRRNVAANPLNYIEKHIGRSVVIILLLLGPWILLPYFTGQTDAAEQTKFLVPSTYQNSVVLRIYGESLICADLDPQNHRLTGSFFMIRMNDEPKPHLSFRDIGQLVS